jgi:hypothetical protein
MDFVAVGFMEARRIRRLAELGVRSLLALLVQKYKH